jgi:hypothetical protein
MNSPDTNRPDVVDAEVVSPAAERAETGRGPVAAGPAPPRRTVHRAAWVLAFAADFVQWVAFPLFFQGAASPFNDALDVGIAIAMVALCGFHWAFVPTVLAELVPGLNLVPTWTLAVWVVTRERRGPGRQT